MRQRLIWLAIVLGAIPYVIVFIFGESSPIGVKLHFSEGMTRLSLGISIVTTMAVGLGLVNLFYIHARNIARKQREWPYSVIVFVTFLLVCGVLGWQYWLDAEHRTLGARTDGALKVYRDAISKPDDASRATALAALTPGQLNLVRERYRAEAGYEFQPRDFLFNYIMNPLGMTVMALLGFYITYAAYRAFRIRSVEGTVMMISAAIMILGSDPIGGLIGAKISALWGGHPAVELPLWANLDQEVMNTGMQRGLQMGISVAIIAASLRTLLGLERGLIQVRGAGD